MNLQKRCGRPGCRASIPVTEAYCPKHKKATAKAYDRKRWQSDPEVMAFYHSRAWRETAKLVMIRDHGLCQECLRHERITKAELVDHIIELRKDWSRRLDPSNLEAKCKSCHSTKHGKAGTYRS
jgi:5-methylcytosine-specific restriction protein A